FHILRLFFSTHLHSLFPLFFFSRYGYPRPLHSFPTRRSSDLTSASSKSSPLEIAGSARRLDPGPGGFWRWRGRAPVALRLAGRVDRKSTRLNSSHVKISYAVFCLKKKNQI